MRLALATRWWRAPPADSGKALRFGPSAQLPGFPQKLSAVAEPDVEPHVPLPTWMEQQVSSGPAQTGMVQQAWWWAERLQDRPFR